MFFKKESKKVKKVEQVDVGVTRIRIILNDGISIYTNVYGNAGVCFDGERYIITSKQNAILSISNHFNYTNDGIFVNDTLNPTETTFGKATKMTIEKTEPYFVKVEYEE